MNASSSEPSLPPRHVKAARALLAWSQKDLAEAAQVATSTVADFERGRRIPVTNNSQAIRRALENAGICFTATGAVIGPTVPMLTQYDRSGTPIRWVSAQDLADWANRVDGSMSLPTLLAFLIRATHGTRVRLRFPADEGVRHPGWDGLTEADVSSEYVPQGTAGWEMSAQQNGIPQKATADYRKRTDNPAPITPATSTYIFVTPRQWPKKDKWAAEQRNEGQWSDVRAYDVNDLVHWIEQAPGVGLWLATRLGKRPPGTQELDEAWIEWSRATRWPLTEDLILSDRDQDAAEVLRWLRSHPGVLPLQATTADEAVAFFHATLSELPDEVNRAYRARSLVVTATAARALANAPAPLILLLTEPEPGLACMLAERGHYVLQVYDEAPLSYGEVRTLGRPSREGIVAALTAAGIANPRAQALARDCARNLTVLRRLISAAPERALPQWADHPPHALLAALLASGWDENSEADKVSFSELADMPYDAAIATLTPSYIDRLNAPLQKIGSTWRIASAFDAWPLLARHLTAADIKRFEITAHAVLGSVDPRFDLDSDERWMAGIRSVRRDYSRTLREGIGQVLILLALWGDQVFTVPDAGRRTEVIVAKLLQDADKRRWWSLSRDFRLLAEASPSAFLSAIEDSLDQNDPPIAVLFGHDKDEFVGTEHLSDLMWALESLAWSPDWMARVTHVLARLDALDVKPRRYSNGPAYSLRHIHMLWLPQTFAPLDDRLRALDLIRKWESDAAWKLMLSILPGGCDNSSLSSLPRWRDFSVDQVESVTWALIRRGASAVSERLLADVGTNVDRWMLLLDRIGNLAPGPEVILNLLEALEPHIIDKDDRRSFWKNLRKILHKNGKFPNAEWRLSDPLLDRLATIYESFAPTDLLEQIAWLFQQAVKLPKLSAEGWQAEQHDIETARLEAAQTLYLKEGIPGILALARLSETPGWLGKALYDLGLPSAEIDALIKTAACSDDSHERHVAHGMINAIVRDRGEAWGTDLIATAREEQWGDVALLAILRALLIERWTWDQVAAIGGDIEIAYWKRMPILGMSSDGTDVGYAIRKLIEVGRARHAMALTSRSDKTALTSDLLVELLQKAVRQPFEGNGDRNEGTMFQYYVTETLGLLDERDDLDVNTLAQLEWDYLALLEHSQRPPKALLRALSERPELFIQMLSAIFKPAEESGVLDPEPPDPEQARMIATQAYRLLELWDCLPGMRDDGTIDGAKMESWIKEARALAKIVGREAMADSQIGTILSASPMGADGAWPAESVRDMLDQFHSREMIEGFVIGKRNRRGITTRLPRDGGVLERQVAAMYRAWAKVISYEYPRTAKALNHLAEWYEQESQSHDEAAERWDWKV